MSTRVDFESLERPESPNTYLVAPDGLCMNASPDAPAPEFDCSPAKCFANLETVVSAHGNWAVQTRDAPMMQIDLVAMTRVLKFKDDMALRVLPDETNPEKSKLAVYSRSRVGYHDFGTNRKRVQSLITELKKKG